MFEVAMNLAKTEAKSAVDAAEQLRRDAQAMQSALDERDAAVNALRVEVAGLKASFKQVADNDGAISAERAKVQQQHEPRQRLQQHRASPPLPRAALADSEHWMQSSTIALASLPSPLPRNADAVYAFDAAHAPLPARAFGSVVDSNVSRKNAPVQKQFPKQQQQQQQQCGAWQLQRPQLHDGARAEHAVSWTAGGYSDNAAKKQRQQQQQQQGGSSRGKLVFFR